MEEAGDEYAERKEGQYHDDEDAGATKAGSSRHFWGKKVPPGWIG